MPALIYYKITQTREVEVSATNMTDAVDLARRVLDRQKTPEDQLNVQSWPKEIELNIKDLSS